MSNSPKYDHQDAMIVGLVRTVQALTAVLYRTSKERDKLENQLNKYLAPESSSFTPEQFAAYKIPLEAALQIIGEIKAVQENQ
ncbi:hypothetical protein [Pseudomonas sp. NFR16]|uniref:hypothetical protein n=1 Tax=Pseudomonas sp. NFR16 TaxID=1566248 RepID=UPI0008D6D0C9|nr:hypothetical protein [Pseudomonas sp. NFR16]SEJ49357.1 hypothetical protein SAMN03159495_3430 [Pseudomonas sp. NFR16]